MASYKHQVLAIDRIELASLFIYRATHSSLRAMPAPFCCTPTISQKGKQHLTTPDQQELSERSFSWPASDQEFEAELSNRLNELKKNVVVLHAQVLKERESGQRREFQFVSQTSVEASESKSASPIECRDAAVQARIELEGVTTELFLGGADRLCNKTKSAIIAKPKIEDIIGVDNKDGIHHVKMLLTLVPESMLHSRPFPDHKKGLRYVLGKLQIALVVQIIMNFIVVTNVVVIGVQSDSNWDGWVYVDAFYTACFVMEILFKVSQDGFRVFAPGQPDFCWQLFDLTLAMISVFETATSVWLSSTHVEDATSFIALRVLRLLRLTRIMQFARLAAFRDLITMVNGILGGLQTFLWSVLLIAVPMYAFAIFFTETIGKKSVSKKRIGDPTVGVSSFDVASHFSTLPKSLFTTFRCIVVGDCSAADGTPMLEGLVITYGWLYGALYAVFCLFMTFGLFNVIVAIYVESTLANAKYNDGVTRKRRLEDQQRLATKTYELLHLFWCQYSGQAYDEPFDHEQALRMEITEEFFLKAVLDPNVRRLFAELEVPDDDFLDMFEMCNADNDGILALDELVEGIKRLRGEPRRSDLVSVLLMLKEVRNRVQAADKKLDYLATVTLKTGVPPGAWRSE